MVIVAILVNRHTGIELSSSPRVDFLPCQGPLHDRVTVACLVDFLQTFLTVDMAPLFDILLQSDQVLDCLIKECAVLFFFFFFSSK